MLKQTGRKSPRKHYQIDGHKRRQGQKQIDRYEQTTKYIEAQAEIDKMS